MQNQPTPESASDAGTDAEAQDYVRRLRKFYSLLGISVLVIALTATIDALTSPGHWWFGWVVFGMGLAIAFSAFDLFVTHRILGPDWERREVAKRIQKSKG